MVLPNARFCCHHTTAPPQPATARSRLARHPKLGRGHADGIGGIPGCSGGAERAQDVPSRFAVVGTGGGRSCCGSQPHTLPSFGALFKSSTPSFLGGVAWCQGKTAMSKALAFYVHPRGQVVNRISQQMSFQSFVAFPQFVVLVLFAIVGPAVFAQQ